MNKHNEFNTAKYSALLRVLKVTSTLPAQITFYTLALGALALAAGVTLPPTLAVLAGGVGVNALSSILERIASGNRISDDEIKTQLLDAINESDIARLLTEDRFDRIMAKLFRRLNIMERIIHNSEQTIINRLSEQQSAHSLTPPFMCGELPPSFVTRSTQTKLLIDALSVESGSSGQVVALVGFDGYGKTTLATAVCYEMKSAYPDGVLWISLGESPNNIVDKILDLVVEVGGKRPEIASVVSAVRHLAKQLDYSKTLVIIDDVRSSKDLNIFMQIRSYATWLITTPFRDILPDNTNSVDVGAMSHDEAVELLGYNLTGTDQQMLGELAKDLSYWPLPLKLANGVTQRQTRQGQNVNQALSQIKENLAKGLSDIDNRESALKEMLELSLGLLIERERKLFYALNIFPKDNNVIPISILEIFWGLDTSETLSTCQSFFDLSLLEAFDYRQQTVHLNKLLHSHVYLTDIEGASLGDLNKTLNQAKQKLKNLLYDFVYLQERLDIASPQALIDAYSYVADTSSLKQLQTVFKQTAHILAVDKTQLGGQLLGHLLNETDEAIKALLSEIPLQQSSPWLRPLTAGLVPVDQSLVQSFTVSNGAVTTIAVIPDKQYAISGSRKMGADIIVWNLENGVDIKRYKAISKSNWVRDLAINQDKRQLIIASKNKAIDVLDLDNGRIVQTLSGHTGGVNAVSLLSEGAKLISGSDDRTVRLWDLAHGLEKTSIAFPRPVVDIAVTPNESQALVALKDGSLRICSLSDEQQTAQIFSGFGKVVNVVTMTSDGQKVIVGLKNGTIVVSDFVSQKPLLGPFQAHFGGVNDVIVHPSQQYFISAGNDSVIKVWDLNNGDELRTFSGHSNGVNVLSITPDGQYLISGSKDETINIWDLTLDTTPTESVAHKQAVNAVTITPDGEYALSASSDGTIKVWRLTENIQLHKTMINDKPMHTLAVISQGKHVVATSREVQSEDKTKNKELTDKLDVWDLESGQKLKKSINTGQKRINALSVSSDGQQTISVADDQSVKIWDLANRKLLTNFSQPLKAAAITPDGKYAVVAAANTLKVLDLTDGGSQLRSMVGQSGTVNALAIDANGKYVISAATDTVLKVWDIDTGAELHSLSGHSRAVMDVTITSDGQYVISAGAEGDLKVWSLACDEAIATLSTSVALLTCAVGPDDRTIVAGDKAGRVHFLRLEGI